MRLNKNMLVKRKFLEKIFPCSELNEKIAEMNVKSELLSLSILFEYKHQDSEKIFRTYYTYCSSFLRGGNILYIISEFYDYIFTRNYLSLNKVIQIEVNKDIAESKIIWKYVSEEKNIRE